MSVIGKRVINAGCGGNKDYHPLKIEGAAVVEIPAGSFVSEVATGIDLSVADQGELLIADKDEFRTRSVDEPWAIGDNVQAFKARSGEFYNVLFPAGVTVTSGAGIAIDAGGLAKLAATPAEAVCFADENVVTTATQLVRIRV